MNVKRFIGRNSREAMQKVKAAFGDEAIVLSTKPAAEGGIEILAMAAHRAAGGLAVPEPMTAPRQPARQAAPAAAHAAVPNQAESLARAQVAQAQAQSSRAAAPAQELTIDRLLAQQEAPRAAARPAAKAPPHAKPA